MKKRIEKAFKKRHLLFLYISTLLIACKEQPETYLESYIESDEQEVHSDFGDITTENDFTKEVSDKDVVESIVFTDTDTEQVNLVYVYVCGAVRCPDVYAMSEGSRICDAIAMAGGLREDADAMSVNQAQFVYDGQMLRIYTREEVFAGLKGAAEDLSEGLSLNEDVSSVETDDRININTATKSQLMTLEGIGNAKADAIIDYRTKEGAFGRIEDLMKIPGIKEGVFEQIKERIKID